MEEARGNERRRLSAELEILERFDEMRSGLGHDYGAGQRAKELQRRRLELGDPELELTAGEVHAAFERIGRPRLRRLERENYRRATPSTQRTLKAWKRLERHVDRARGTEAMPGRRETFDAELASLAFDDERFTETIERRLERGVVDRATYLAALRALLETDLELATEPAQRQRFERRLAIVRRFEEPDAETADRLGVDEGTVRAARDAQERTLAREVVTVGWDGASRPMLRYRDELGLPEHQRQVVPERVRVDLGGGNSAELEPRRYEVDRALLEPVILIGKPRPEGRGVHCLKAGDEALLAGTSIRVRLDEIAADGSAALYTGPRPLSGVARADELEPIVESEEL